MFWGLGHTLTLGAAGTLVLALGLGGRLSEGGLELIVAAMLVILAIARLRPALRGLAGLPADHLRARHVTDHEHGRLEVVHSHAHHHEGHVHEHAHVHPSRRLLAALGGGRGHAMLRPLVVGAVHGVAGSAAVPLALLATVRTAGGAVLYLGLFGLER